MQPCICTAALIQANLLIRSRPLYILVVSINQGQIPCLQIIKGTGMESVRGLPQRGPVTLQHQFGMNMPSHRHRLRTCTAALDQSVRRLLLPAQR
jgi:hypothetical protein